MDRIGSQSAELALSGVAAFVDLSSAAYLYFFGTSELLWVLQVTRYCCAARGESEIVITMSSTVKEISGLDSNSGVVYLSSAWIQDITEGPQKL